YESTRSQFREGVVLSEQVLDAEYAYRKAQARHAQAIADYEIEYASVLHAMGQIWGENDGN
ncbi:MAG TPA: TolC family protein, partial [Fodinibius sp.]|nr:TolC family protein [Fodinibius sp.]